MSEKLFIFDTTLRDGEQVPGCQLNTIEKIEVARALEELGYIVCNKSFVGRKPRTVFQATPQGREAFKSHIEALEKFLKSK